ncbi:hypothetical protein HYDPIDRAFT_112660 [Hydnomerulius pinastri MD-312]|uniref:Uncharacterized protein n=1 Tax=Hydnomerulius pinastri MD-312 TaxID=994086 RepID=A0A0C9WEQ7_9AGAM|nr:hypothetical protein HYDPIDRAFT_112660 [Hydnomerulius pinastri MD-312]
MRFSTLAIFFSALAACTIDSLSVTGTPLTPAGNSQRCSGEGALCEYNEDCCNNICLVYTCAIP